MNSTNASSSLTIDFHTHSDYSDGLLSPQDLVELGANQGLEVLALTDHDTLDGLDEAARAAAGHGLSFVPGIEISSTWEGGEIHIVGLGIDTSADDLSAGVAQLTSDRSERTQTIIHKLLRTGVSDAISTITTVYGRDHLTRSHFARYLCALGVCANEEEAFRRYLGRNKPAFVTSGWVDYTEAVRWIRAAGGIAVLAHPQHYNLTATKLNRLLERFVRAGGEAMEIQPVRATDEVRGQLIRHLHKHALSGSVGSDFHGESYQIARFGSLIPIPAGVRPVWHDPRITRFFNPNHSQRILA